MSDVLSMRYKRLRERPDAFQQLAGVDPDAFESLFGRFAEVWVRRHAVRTHTRRDRRPRRRAPGAGRTHVLSEPDRLLMTLVWLNVKPTYRVLGCLFDLVPPAARQNVRDVLDDLAALPDLPVSLEPRPGPKIRDLVALRRAYPLAPDVGLPVDSDTDRDLDYDAHYRDRLDPQE